MPKISKSKSPEHQILDPDDGTVLVLEPENQGSRKGEFLLSISTGGEVPSEEGIGWNCLYVTVEQLEEMLNFAKSHRP